MKFFKFADRFVPIRFFEEEPITVTLKICDETDERIVKVSGKLAAAGKLLNTAKRLDTYREALNLLIGEERAELILARSEEADCFAIESVIMYVLQAYGDQKRKNLQARA